MRNYWSCRKFADWVRGTPKINSGTGEEWTTWTRNAKGYSPIRYWLAEDGLSYLEDIWCFIPEKINNIRYYLNNRYVLRSNSLTADPQDIAPGAWSDVGNRFLPCMFNELVDFIEIEQAWMMCCWDDAARAKYSMPWWRAQWWTRWFRVWRCAEAGVAHLHWAMSLQYNDEMHVDKTDPGYGKPTGQALAAKEQLALYNWWKNVYRHRPDVYEVTGWSAYCERTRDNEDGWLFGRTKSKKEQKEVDAMMEQMQVLEAAYEAEDTEMMVRLIKIRGSLWT